MGEVGRRLRGDGEEVSGRWEETGRWGGVWGGVWGGGEEAEGRWRGG